MLHLLLLKEKIRVFYVKFGRFVNAITRFILTLVAMILLNIHLGYMEELNGPVLPIILALACAFLPYGAISVILSIFMVAHISSVSLEMAILMTIVILLIAILYYGFCPGDSYVLILVPICFYLKIPYIVPLLLGLGGSLLSIIPVSCGILIYYMISYISLNAITLTNHPSLDMTQRYMQMINASFSNREMLIYMIAFAITILVVFLIHNLSIDYAWYIAIGSGVISLFISIFITEYIFDVSITVLDLIIGVLISAFIAIGFAFFVFSVDYSRTERTQFEDDDYYYYVKAVPKITVTASTPQTKFYNYDAKLENTKDEDKKIENSKSEKNSN